MSTCFPCGDVRIKNNSNYFNFSKTKRFKQKIGDVCTYYSDSSLLDNQLVDISVDVFSEDNSTGIVKTNYEILNSFEFSVQVDFSDTNIYPGEVFIVNIRLYFENGDVKSNSFYVCATDSFGKISNGCDSKNLYVINSTKCVDGVTQENNCTTALNEEYPNLEVSSYEYTSLVPIPDWVNFVGLKFDKTTCYEIKSNGVVVNSGSITNLENLLILNRTEALNFTYGPKNSGDKLKTTIYFMKNAPDYYNIA